VIGKAGESQMIRMKQGKPADSPEEAMNQRTATDKQIPIWKSGNIHTNHEFNGDIHKSSPMLLTFLSYARWTYLCRSSFPPLASLACSPIATPSQLPCQPTFSHLYLLRSSCKPDCCPESEAFLYNHCVYLLQISLHYWFSFLTTTISHTSRCLSPSCKPRRYVIRTVRSGFCCRYVER